MFDLRDILYRLIYEVEVPEVGIISKTPPVKKEPEVKDLKPGVFVESSVTLRFSNGYRFTVSFEDQKMVMKAELNGAEAFYLDDIPREFILSLKNMLASVGDDK